jgi:hypothetical protein
LTVPFSTSVSRIRQQRDISGALDCFGKHALMNGAVAGNTPGQNLAAFRDKVSQEPGIFKINDIYLLDAETADSAPANAATTATLRRATAVKIIIAIVTPPSIFIICRHSYLLNSES